MQENSQLIIFLVISFTSVLSVLGVFFAIFFNKYNQKLKERQKEAINNLVLGQKNERSRIARDLHDGMGAELGSIIHVVDELELSDPVDAEIINRAKLKLKAAMQSIRQISHDLMPVTLNTYGLVSAIEDLIEKKTINGIPIFFNCDLKRLPLSSEAEFHLYKITQELITNTVKHSEANEITLDIYFTPEKKQLEYTFADDGIGLDKIKKPYGIGLKNIKTRVALINGSMSIDGVDGLRISIIVNTN